MSGLPRVITAILGALVVAILVAGIAISDIRRHRSAASPRACALAARDLGASPWQTIRFVVLPIIAPSLIGVALFGFTLSYDEFARTLLTSGSHNTLPLEIFGMTTNVTSPVIFALGTLTTIFSFLIIAVFLFIFWLTDRRRKAQGSDAGKGMV